MSTVVGIDVGGTFTDLWAVDKERGLVTMKVPSTPAAPSRAVSDALAAAQIDARSIVAFSHGITVATNILIQRNGAKTGLLATRGFSDILELGRRDRPQTYGMWGVADPLVPRDRRLEITERLDYLGNVVTALDEDAVAEASTTLAREGVECIVVAFLNSYANPAHEARAREIIARTCPGVTVVLSSDVLREFHEFERISTTCIQAYVSPAVEEYARTLERDLRAAGYAHHVAIMQSNGGVVGLAKVRDRAARLIRSGPAAGVVGAINVARQVGVSDIVTADMGGTSFDVAIVSDGRARVTEETQLGFRMPLRLPTVDVASIGAGGGSVAWVDDGGLLHVGPQSVGADPGPAAWGRGGQQPTVTDANVVLGRIGVQSRIGTSRTLDIEAARTVVARLGGELGLDLDEAAAGILEVANNNMANLIRMMTIERGLDPRDFAYVPFGGAGPLHATAIARLLGMQRVLVPPYPGVLSAMGSLLADVRYDTVRTIDRPLDATVVDEIVAACHDHADWGATELASDDIDVESSSVEYSADVCYEGQLHTLTIEFDPQSKTLVADLERAFEERYEREFITTLERPRRLVNVRATVIGRRRLVDSRRFEIEGAGGALPTVEREVYCDGTWLVAAVHDRRGLRVGGAVAGPCVIEQGDTTFFMEPNTSGHVDEWHNLIVELGP